MKSKRSCYCYCYCYYCCYYYDDDYFCCCCCCCHCYCDDYTTTNTTATTLLVLLLLRRRLLQLRRLLLPLPLPLPPRPLLPLHCFLSYAYFDYKSSSYHKVEGPSLEFLSVSLPRPDQKKRPADEAPISITSNGRLRFQSSNKPF